MTKVSKLKTTAAPIGPSGLFKKGDIKLGKVCGHLGGEYNRNTMYAYLKFSKNSDILH